MERPFAALRPAPGGTSYDHSPLDGDQCKQPLGHQLNLELQTDLGSRVRLQGRAGPPWPPHSRLSLSDAGAWAQGPLPTASPSPVLTVHKPGLR